MNPFKEGIQREMERGEATGGFGCDMFWVRRVLGATCFGGCDVFWIPEKTADRQEPLGVFTHHSRRKASTPKEPQRVQ